MNTKPKVIEGRSSPMLSTPQGDSCAFVRGSSAPRNWPYSSLVIGDKAVPLSVVVEMLREMADACDFAPIHYTIAEKHGITL